MGLEWRWISASTQALGSLMTTSCWPAITSQALTLAGGRPGIPTLGPSGSSAKSYLTGNSLLALSPISLTSAEDLNYTSDCFVAKYSSAAVPGWAKQYGGTDNDLGNAVAVDFSGNPVATGGFYNNVNGTPATFGSQSLTSAGGV